MIVYIIIKMLLNEDETFSTSINLDNHDIENNKNQIIIDSISSAMHENQQNNLESVSLDSSSLDLDIKSEDSKNNITFKDIFIQLFCIIYIVSPIIIVIIVLYYLFEL